MPLTQDDIIEEMPGTDITQILKSNILEVEKLIETGLGLPVSFKISKFNVSSDSWLKSLAKKRKAIHSGTHSTDHRCHRVLGQGGREEAQQLRGNCLQ